MYYTIRYKLGDETTNNIEWRDNIYSVDIESDSIIGAIEDFEKLQYEVLIPTEHYHVLTVYSHDDKQAFIKLFDFSKLGLNKRFEIVCSNGKRYAYGMDQLQGYFLMCLDDDTEVYVTHEPFNIRG